jgi:hypothetical protein
MLSVTSTTVHQISTRLLLIRNTKAMFEVAAWRRWLPYAPNTEVFSSAGDSLYGSKIL